jgi:hypothetical protein
MTTPGFNENVPLQSLSNKKSRFSRKKTEKTDKKQAKKPRSPSVSQPIKVPKDAVPFERALRLLQDAKIPGLMSREPLRKAFHAKRLPGFIGEKRKIYFDRGPLFEILGGVPVGDAVSVDQALVRHFEASEFNNPISAVMAGIASNLEKARQVFEDWLSARSDPRIAARIQAKKQTQQRTGLPNSPHPEECWTCHRPLTKAAEEDATINLAVMGHVEQPSMLESAVLERFGDKKCTDCWNWFADAPVNEMRAVFDSSLESKKKT